MKALKTTLCFGISAISFFGAYLYRMNIAIPQWEIWKQQYSDLSTIPHSIDYPVMFLIAIGICAMVMGVAQLVGDKGVERWKRLLNF